MKVYHITVVFDKKEQRWIYKCETEQVLRGETNDMDEAVNERGYVDLSEYFDEEGLELIEGCYIMGEA